ncbi:hypothetical protein ACS0TY_026220 [Phlomoides rotata]
MGKKGSWFSVIKKAFTNSSKEKPSYGFDKKSSKEKKTSRGILRHGESISFIPRSREPSSIEKILGEADQLLTRPPASSQEPKTSPPRLWKPASPRANSPEAASPRVSSARLTSPKAPLPRFLSPRTVLPTTSTHPAASSKNAPPKVAQNRKEIRYVQRPEPTLRNQHRSAAMIQATYRGYLARRNFRALRGLMRLQGVVRGQNAKRQTTNAMKQMQLLVRVQTQIQSRRIQMLENQALLSQAHRNDKEAESTLSKWTSNQLPEAGNNGDWDDSVLTKEEREARLRKKVEAVVKRERAMAYAYSHQLWKANPKSAQSPVDIRSNGFPWWWNWLERQLPPATTPLTQASTKNIPVITPPRPVSEYKASPQLNYRHSSFTSDDHKEVIIAKQVVRPSKTPSPAPTIKNSKPRGNSPYDFPTKDDDSLTSCPAFSVPSYMSPTVSAKAKVRPNSNPKERLPATPANDSKRRFSFSLTTNIGSFKWNKGSSKESASQKVLHKHITTPHSIGDLSIDSTVSMPAMVGRRPFNRFV